MEMINKALERKSICVYVMVQCVVCVYSSSGVCSAQCVFQFGDVCLPCPHLLGTDSVSMVMLVFLGLCVKRLPWTMPSSGRFSCEVLHVTRSGEENNVCFKIL